MGSQCDILVLSASFGMGHNSVAAAICELLRAEDEHLKIKTVDIMDIYAPKVKPFGVAFYRFITKNSPSLYNIFYNLKRDHPNNFLDEMLYDLFLKRVGEYILEVDPKLIISTFPLGSGFVSRAKEKYGLQVPLITAITDVVDSWEWIHNNTDLYFVPCKIVEERLVGKGIEKDKIRVTGIPVRHDFLKRNEHESGKKETHHILIMGGTMKKTKLTKDMMANLERMENTKIVVVTGNDSDLYKKLTQYGPFKNIEVIGFSNEIAQMMEQADVVVTKPGGATLFEAINKGVPLVLKRSKIGQEEENLKFIEAYGLGFLAEDDDDLETVIMRSVFDEDGLDQVEKNLEEIRTELATDRIAEYILDLL
jgi:processive 1,2-diacylglycerol beta-glucosyltransferase